MLRGKKITLRPVSERDLEQIACWRNDPDNRRFFFTTSIINPAGQQEWFEKLIADPNRFIYVIETVQGKPVGIIGMDKIDRRNQEAEIGPGLLDSNERGRGYIEEALELVLRYGFEELNLHRIYGACYSFNKTIELAKFFGFVEEGVLRKAVFTQGRFHDKVILGLLREEWDSGELGNGHNQ